MSKQYIPQHLIPSPPSSISSETSDSDSASDSDSDDSTCFCPPCVSPSPKSSLPLQSPPVIPSSHFSKLLIIGAGPHALALVARLKEDRPANLYTDLEHERLSWLRRSKDRIKKGSVKMGMRNHLTGNRGSSSSFSQSQKQEEFSSCSDIRVLDATSSTWLGRWNFFFKGLEIRFLRSPMWFHPAPGEVDALVTYAKRTDREDELREVKGVVGKELSKHQRKKGLKMNHTSNPINERSRSDYFTPSTSLFTSFISDSLLTYYSLPNSTPITQTTVTSISYTSFLLESSSESNREDEESRLVKGFLVTSRNPDGSDSVYGTESLVLSIGPTSSALIPEFMKLGIEARQKRIIKGEGWCHSNSFAEKAFQFPTSELKEKIKEGRRTTMVIVGGGLTSAQICDLALKKGISKVILITRGHIKSTKFPSFPSFRNTAANPTIFFSSVKPFDFSLPWITKYSNLQKMIFWSEPSSYARLQMIKEARNGGSVTPFYSKVLKELAASGKLEIREESSIRSAQWDERTNQWNLEIESKKKAVDDSNTLRLGSIDYLLLSTGSRMEFDKLPFLTSMLDSHPLEVVEGYPVLTNDLQWNEKVPMFVIGAYAMLQLGPDAANLGGTRNGAERVVYRLNELERLKSIPINVRVRGSQESRKNGEELRESRAGGDENFFEGLGEVMC